MFDHSMSTRHAVLYYCSVHNRATHTQEILFSKLHF